MEWNRALWLHALLPPAAARCWELRPQRFLAGQWDIASETKSPRPWEQAGEEQEEEEKKKIYADISTACCTHITLLAALAAIAPLNW